MNTYENLIYELKDGIAFVTANHPKVNALHSGMLDELTAVFTAIEADDAVKAVILTGAGRAFVAGADISQMVELDAFEIRALGVKGQHTMNLIDQLSKPVLAAVNGFALGGGNELAMACDFRFASEDAKFGQPEVNLGIFPFFGGTQRLPRLVGRGVASYLIASGEMIDANEAYRIGLVNKVFPADTLLEEAEKFMRTLLTKSPIGVKMALLAIGEGLNTDLQSGLVIEREAAMSTFCSEDRITGMRAFLDKQTAVFSNK